MKIVIDIPDKDYEFIKDLQSLIIGGRGNCKTLQYNVINAIKKGIPYEEQPSKWIPVSERLPDDMQRVLIWFEYYRYGDYNCMYQTYGFGYVCDGEWSPFINGETGWRDARIIAWMPLLEPYKEGGESDV